MPFDPSSIATLSRLSGPRAGFSAPAPKLLDDADRQRLGLPPASTVNQPAKKETLDGTPNGLGKDDFLKLLLAQLANQDPLHPMDDTQFIAQLAQFNALEQQQETNKHLVDLITAQSLAQATALLGRQIEAKDAKGKAVSGEVSAVTLVDGQPKLTVGSTQVALSDVTKVLPDSASTGASTGTASSTSTDSTTTSGAASSTAGGSATTSGAASSTTTGDSATTSGAASTTTGDATSAGATSSASSGSTPTSGSAGGGP